jgi:hypothetical protein
MVCTVPMFSCSGGAMPLLMGHPRLSPTGQHNKPNLSQLFGKTPNSLTAMYNHTSKGTAGHKSSCDQ